MKRVNKSQLKLINMLLDKLDQQHLKKSITEGFFGRQIESTKDLSFEEASSLIQFLDRRKEMKCAPMIGKVVFYLCLMGYTTADEKPDYKRINPYIENIGSRNPKRLRLPQMGVKTLRQVLNQVEARYKKEINQAP